ncbi:MAG: hypothetical protein QM820_21820 [Minicystis sp.]
MTRAPEDAGERPRSPLYTSPLVLGAVLVIAVLVAFGGAVDGELVWDDATMVGAAARLPSPWAAFSRDFFDLGAAAQSGAGASWFRPLVTLSFALDLRLFPAAPQFGLHLVNLAWHALAAVLVAGALVRWTRASTTQATLAAWVAAFFWTVLPAKVENVTWISGRGDVMGLALLLIGLALRRRIAGTIARAVVAGVATVIALLCKEGFVVAPAIWAVEIASEIYGEATRDRIKSTLRSPEVLASAGMVALYLALRRLYLPIHGGGEAMFAGLSIVDRISLVLETLGHALHAIVLCFEAHLLRGPVGFAAPFVLKREPGMALAGAALVVIVAVIAWRLPRARMAAALFAITILPVANLVPAGLESRLSDRFLYVPSLAVALGMAALLGEATARAFRAVALGIGTSAVGLALVSSGRAVHFRSAGQLWEWERAHGDRATTVLHNAAMAALRERNYARARERLLETAARYGELGFDEGYPYLVQAAGAEAQRMGEQDAVTLAAYRRLVAALLAGRPEKVVFHPPDGRAFMVPTGTPSALEYAATHARELRMRLALLDARAGREEAAAAARAEIEACPRCRGVLREAARVEMALAHPDRAEALLKQLGPDEDVALDLLDTVAELQTKLLANGTEIARACALFLGEAYAPACKLGEPAAGTVPPEARQPIAVACVLAGDGEAWRRLRPALNAAAVQEIEGWESAWRSDPARRLGLFGVRAPR